MSLHKRYPLSIKNLYVKRDKGLYLICTKGNKNLHFTYKDLRRTGFSKTEFQDDK